MIFGKDYIKAEVCVHVCVLCFGSALPCIKTFLFFSKILHDSVLLTPSVCVDTLLFMIKQEIGLKMVIAIGDKPYKVSTAMFFLLSCIYWINILVQRSTLKPQVINIDTDRKKTNTLKKYMFTCEDIFTGEQATVSKA